MASKLAEAFVELRTDSSKLNSGLAAARHNAERTQATLTNLKRAAIGALGLIGVGVSAAAMIEFLRQSTLAAADAERQTKRFDASLRAAGVSAGKLRDEISSSVDALKKKYSIDDDVIRTTMTLGLNMGVTAEQITDATETAIGLSEITGGDLNSSMQLVTKALYGNYAAVGKLIPSIKNLQTNEQKLTELQRIAADGMKQRQAAMNSTSGSLDRLSIAWDDFGKAVGGAIIETGHLTGILEGIIWRLEWWSEVIGGTGDATEEAADRQKRALQQIANIAKQNQGSVMRFFEANANGAKGAAQEIQAQLAAETKLIEKQKERNEKAKATEQEVRQRGIDERNAQKAHDDQVAVERSGPDAKRAQGQARGSRLHDEAGALAARVAAQIEAAYRRAQAVTEARDPANAATSRAKTEADIAKQRAMAIDGMMEGVLELIAAERERFERAARGLENNPDYKKILEAIERNTKNMGAKYN